MRTRIATTLLLAVCVQLVVLDEFARAHSPAGEERKVADACKALGWRIGWEVFLDDEEANRLISRPRREG
jgi:hypothetical protein